MRIKSRQALVEQARTYLGTPFRHRGRNRGALDCAGLVIKSLQDLGYSPVDLKVYGREPARDGLRKVVQENMGQPIEPGQPWIPGDVLLMKFVREPHHVGLVGSHPIDGLLTLIHCYGDVGSVVEHILDDSWKKKVLEVYRFEEGEV